MLDHFPANRKILFLLFCATAAPLFITACTEVEGDPLAFIAPGPPNQDRPAIPPKEELQQMTPGAATLAMAPTDPFIGLVPFEPRPGGMKGSLGLNVGTYLDQNTGTPEERIDRLERVIAAMHKDMQAMAAPLQKPAATTPIPVAPATMQPVMDSTPAAAMNKPVGAPENLVGGDMQAPPPPVAAPMPENTKPIPAGPQPVTNAGGPVGTGLRVGEHSDKVRLVIDVTQDTAFNADLDNTENLLIVELPGIKWTGPAQEPFPGMPVMKSYRVDSMNGGTMIVVQLDTATSILSQTKIGAVSGNGRRIVIDLKK